MPLKKCQVCGTKFEAKKPQTVLCQICQREERAREDDDPDELPEMTSVDRVLSRGTSASNPGHVKVDWLHTFGSWPMQTAGSLVFSIGVGIVTGFSILQKQGRPEIAAVLGAVAGLGVLLMIWIPWSRVMIYGCANPGIIVDAEKGLVAVTTDLDCGGATHFRW